MPSIWLALLWKGGSHELQLVGLPAEIAERIASFWPRGPSPRDGLAIVVEDILVVVRRSCLDDGPLYVQRRRLSAKALQ